MRKNHKVSVIIPALNEEESIGKVIKAIPKWVDEIIVVDNGSTDQTNKFASDSGARVLFELKRGYGAACLKGIASLKFQDIIVFLDGDYSDYPEEMHLLVDPIISGRANLVIGSRKLGNKEKGALTVQARFGNWLACRLIRLRWGVIYSDLGPFRAIRYHDLISLAMQDTNYGWTVEMQLKAAIRNLKFREVPVSYRKRVGKSKVSGTIKGVVGAGYKILGTIFFYSFKSKF